MHSLHDKSSIPRSCAHLGSVLLEETRGVHAVGNRAADDREPVEDERGLIGVSLDNLREDVEKDDDEEERGD